MNVFSKPILAKKTKEVKEERESSPTEFIPPNVLKIKQECKEKIKNYFKEKHIIKLQIKKK
jgi:hypothetical protein